jgi:uncharacterized repeat protein (TIGR01451 family)
MQMCRKGHSFLWHGLCISESATKYIFVFIHNLRYIMKKYKTRSGASSLRVQLLRKIFVEQLEGRELMAADARVVWLPLAQQPLLGEQIVASLQLSSSGTSVGYGPYVEVIVPTKGINNAGGLHYVSGSGKLLDQGLTERIVTFDANGRANHPLAKDNNGNAKKVTGRTGDQLVVFELPVGSYHADQPSLQIDMRLSVDATADLGQSLTVVAAGGYRFGLDPLDNPTLDPSIRGTSKSLAVTPGLVDVRIDYLGPENETAMGTNFQRAYKVSVDIAEGAQIEDLSLDHLLDNNQMFLGIQDSTWGSGILQVSHAPAIGSASNDATINLDVSDWIGRAGIDATYQVNFAIPSQDASNTAIVNRLTGAGAESHFTINAAGTWVRSSGSNSNSQNATRTSFSSVPAIHTLQDQAIAVQQSYRITQDNAASGLSPADVLEYTLDFQVSDYVTISDLQLTVKVPDGQRLRAEAPITIQVSGLDGVNGSTTHTFAGQVVQLMSNGEQQIQFNVSNELLRLFGVTGVIRGGLAQGGSGSAVFGKIVYQTTVQDNFQTTFPSGDRSVDEGDLFRSTVIATARMIDLNTGLPTTNFATDDSSTRQVVPVGSLTTSVYAINGVLSPSSRSVSAGDLVTYRLTRTVRSSDIEDLILNQFLPLPIFTANGLTLNLSSSTPVENSIVIGPNDTFHSAYGVNPQLTNTGASNRLSLRYNDFDLSDNTTRVIDLLFTTRVQDRPFADALWLSSQSNSTQGSTNNGSFALNAMTDVQYTRPVLNITKGVVSADNSRAKFSKATSPAGINFQAPNSPTSFTGSLTSSALSVRSVDADISKVDAGDFVRFATVVENVGSGRNGAFNTKIRDVLPAGFEIPATGLNLRVSNGMSVPVPLTSTDLFGTGIELNSVVAAYNANSGTNLVVVTYDLRVSNLVSANQKTQSSAEIVHYAAINGGTNFVTSSLTNSASTTMATPSIQHSLIATNRTHTTGTNVAVGETVTYRARVSIPEGMMSDAVLRLTAPRGLAFNQLMSIQIAPSIVLLNQTAISILTNAVIESSGTSLRDGGGILRLALGDLSNLDRNNIASEDIDIVYSATVVNDLDLDQGDTIRTTANWSYSGGVTTAVSPNATVVEPEVEVVKSWSSQVVDANDRLTVTMEVTAKGAATAFNIELVDGLPTGTAYVSGSLRWISGVQPTSISDATSLYANWDSLAVGAKSRLVYEVVVSSNVHSGATLSSPANITWTSLPGQPGQIALSNALSYERTGNASHVGGSANDYRQTTNPQVHIAPTTVSMRLVETSQAHTTGNDVTIGEFATHEVIVTVPEGVHRLRLSDLAPTNVAVLDIQSLTLVSIGSNLTGSALVLGSIASLSDANGDGTFRDLAFFDLGTVTNTADNVRNDADQLVFRVVSRAVNTSKNSAGDTATMQAVIDYVHRTNSAAHSLKIVEPRLNLSQTIGSDWADAGDVIGVSLNIDHRDATSSQAFILDIRSSLQADGFTLVPGSVSATGGTLVSGNLESDLFVEVDADSLGQNQSVQVNYQVRINNSAVPGQIIAIKSRLVWASTNGQGGREYNLTSQSNVTVNASTLAGQVFLDANQDGVNQFGDFGMGQVLVTLTGVDHLGQTIERTTATDSAGQYSFAGLRPGTYRLVQVQPANISDGRDYAGSFGGQVTDDLIDSIVIPRGARSIVSGYNFTESPLTWISGTVFVDENEDSVLGKDEDGIPGIEIQLAGITHQGASVSHTVYTNDRGYYVFGQLEPGTYTISEGPTAGYFDANDQLGNRGGTKTNDTFSAVIVDVTHPGEMYNFGEYRPASLTGNIYIDYDRDLVLDAKDGLVSNVLVQLSGVNDLADVVQLEMFTDVDGEYRFENLRPGNYEIQSTSLESLEQGISNVGLFLGASGPKQNNGVGVAYGFSSIRLPAGAQGVAYDIGHVDPEFTSSMLSPTFESQLVFNGTGGNDTFLVQMTRTGGQVTLNGSVYSFDSAQNRTVRLLANSGQDLIEFRGSEDKEEIDLRRSSARVWGTWYEAFLYGTENIQFVGGGNEDVARFYDTDGNENFVASSFEATMSGSDFQNSVSGVHRIYAFATNGTDTASLTGTAGLRDNFVATPQEAKLYRNEYFISANNFDEVTGNANDLLDRSYMYDSTGDDQLTTTEMLSQLSGSGYQIRSNRFVYLIIAAKGGGNDIAHLTGSTGNDQFQSRPSESTFVINDTRVTAQGFEQLTVIAGTGTDIATVNDSHYQDTFTANAESATLSNSVSNVVMVGFDRVRANMHAGGQDIGILHGSNGVDTFRASPDNWSLVGTGYTLEGSGFTQVSAHGDAQDIAYLYDSSFDDVLSLSSSSGSMSGQRFENRAFGFGKLNAEASTGNDRVLFTDDAARSTIRFNGVKATIFGTGFSQNATGFDGIDAYYTDLGGRDRVELSGHIDVELVASDIATANYKLSLMANLNSSELTINDYVENL